MPATHYIAIELNGNRKVIRAKDTASIGDVTEQAFGFAAARLKDATILAAATTRARVELALARI